MGFTGFYKIKKAWRYLLHFGPKEFFNHVIERLEPQDVPYGPWFEKHRADEDSLNKLRKKNRDTDPLVSVVVPAYETDEKYLREMAESVIGQTYAKVELCIADASDRTDKVEKTLAGLGAIAWDKEEVSSYPVIRYKKLEKNIGISDNTNEAIAFAKGEYIALLDHDDLIEPDAIRRIIDGMTEKGADMAYTDEDKVNSSLTKHFQPNLKPEFNLDLLRSNNYITHFLVVKKTLLDRAGLLRAEYDGAQDYDLIFRCAENAQGITRIPGILYHWRTHEASTADNPLSKQYAYDAGKRAIEGNLERSGVKGEVTLLPDFGFYRVHYPVQGEPLVSIIIPNKDNTELLKSCINGLRQTEYRNYEILIVENGSTEDSIFEYYKELEQEEDVTILTWNKGFNYSAIDNFASESAKGEYLLFLNNDIRTVITDKWLSEMLGVCQRDDVGIVGAKLYYPDNRIQHAGCVIGIGTMHGGGVAGAMFVDMPRSRSGYLHKANLMQDLSAVTAACMLIKKDVFEKAGRFTEELTVAFNDIDLCLKVRELGYLVVYDPYAEAYHDESRTRGPEDSEEKLRRFQSEIEYMRSAWTDILKNGDPYYNPNLSLKKWDYSLKP